jgi:predicted esterase
VNKGKDEGRSYSYYGPDVEFIDRALEQTFDRLAVDTKKLAVEGFSDGASYALSIGLSSAGKTKDGVGGPTCFFTNASKAFVLPSR